MHWTAQSTRIAPFLQICWNSSKSLQQCFLMLKYKSLSSPSGLWKSKTHRDNLAFLPQKLHTCIGSTCYCILPLQPGWTLSVTDSTLGPSTSQHCREPPGIHQPRTRLLPGTVLSFTTLFEWVTDLMQGLGWSKTSRTFGSQRWGNFPHTKYKGSVSYSEQQTLLRERKKH